MISGSISANVCRAAASLGTAASFVKITSSVSTTLKSSKGGTEFIRRSSVRSEQLQRRPREEVELAMAAIIENCFSTEPNHGWEVIDFSSNLVGNKNINELYLCVIGC